MNRVMSVLVLLAAVTLATTIRVPSEQPSIQAGLNAASSGDTVLVAPGFYKELITWPSTDGIKLIGEQGRDSTTIDGDTLGVCVTMSSGNLTRATVIQGFTITRGKVTTNSGSGIVCRDASPSILDNHITRCQGAGIHLNSYNASFAPLVKGNEISGCWKEIAGSWNYGAGIHVASGNAAGRPEICYNWIHHDSLRRGAWNYGAGIFCDANAFIYQNVIEANVAAAEPGDIGRGHGAGIYIDMNQYPVVFNNLIIGNRCVTDAWNYGAGVKADLGSKPYIVSNTFVANVCQGGNWAYGGGLYNDMRCTTLVKNNIFAGNTAGSGSAIYNYTSSQNGEVTSLHNDYFNNTLSGVTMGPGDITLDPLFVTGSYRLSQTAAGQPSTSPCVDAGDTLTGVSDLNLDSLLRSWSTRTDSFQDVGVLDIGYHYPCGLLLGAAEPVVSRVASRRLTVSPNPVRGGFAMLRWSGLGHDPDSPSRIGSCPAPVMSLRIYDATGRMVRHSSLEIRKSPFRLDLRSLSPGAYIVRLDASGSIETQRFVVGQR